MRAIQTHREYYEEMAATLPWHPYRPAAYLGTALGAYWLMLFVVFGITIGLPIALGMGYVCVRAWTWEWFSYQVWKLYGQHDA